ncbi:hypothetical protein AKJ09_01634 [Labilithrix luteola]|uniref:Uncharacterized protein n=1 Tax=Labilithrix luteola TaxID=1391654 RepID=A0A0K1PN53_9BACT|nr:hypothetical protein AKJ09_01634 [Labilithrix luteola]
MSTTRAKLYLGQTAKVDGASVAPNITANIAWTVLDAPFESAVKTETLRDAASSTPSFEPDVLGTYSLQVSGENEGVSSSVIVLIEAIDAPVFWREALVSVDDFEGDAGTLSTSLATHVGGVHGTRDRVVDCVVSMDTEDDAQSQMTYEFAMRLASAGDTWEAPPGMPSRVVFPTLSVDKATKVASTALAVATSQSSCGAAEAKTLVTVEMPVPSNEGVIPLPNVVYAARFSPDGNRIAYVHDTNSKTRLATIGFDGSSNRDLSPFHAVPNGGALDPSAGIPPLGGDAPRLPVAVRWKDETHVGWITFVRTSVEATDFVGWELYVAEDRDGSTPELAMHCSVSMPASFDFLPDGTIVVAARHLELADAGSVPMNLLVYRPDATKQCELVRKLTGGTTTDDIARDLALSPDKTQLAFFSGFGSGEVDNGLNSLALFTVPVDGSRPPALVPGAEQGAQPGRAPRWVAGGTSLTWGQVNYASQGASGFGQVMSISARGGTTTALTTGGLLQVPNDRGGTRTSLRTVSGIGQGCNVSHGTAPTGIVAIGAMLGGAALVTRRKRRTA